MGVATNAWEASVGCGVARFSCGDAAQAVANNPSKTSGRDILKKLWMQDRPLGFSLWFTVLEELYTECVGESAGDERSFRV